MTRDHDIKRKIRARMKVTGERYTVARSALVAPAASDTRLSETSHSLGGTMAAVHTGLLEELDERGFAVLRSFITPRQLGQSTRVVDEVVAEALADKQELEHQRRAPGETGWVDVWSPGVPGWIFQDVTDRPELAWLLHEARLLEIATAARGARVTFDKIRAIASIPGYGHEGFHPDRRPDEISPPAAIGSWRGVAFSLMLSPNRAESGTVRALPGSHRTPPHFEHVGSAMPPHPEEVRIDAEPGDVLVYSADLWKSATFNAGTEALKSLWIA